MNLQIIAFAVTSFVANWVIGGESFSCGRARHRLPIFGEALCVLAPMVATSLFLLLAYSCDDTGTALLSTPIPADFYNVPKAS